MKFTNLRHRLMDPEAAAGSSAPAAAPAPTPAAAPAATPTPVAVQGGSGDPVGQSAAPAPVPAATAWPDHTKDYQAWEAKWDAATDEEREAWTALEAQGKSEQSDSVEDPADLAPVDPVDPNAAPPVPAVIDGTLSPEWVSKQPPEVQEILSEVQATLKAHEPYAPFLNPEFQTDLETILTDPMVVSRISELKQGIQVPEHIKQGIDTARIVDDLVASGAIKEEDLGIDLDRDGAISSVDKIVQAAVAKATEIATIKAKYEQRVEAEKNRRVSVLDRQFNELASSVAQLRSDKPIDSPEHPINEYREHLLGLLETGKISFELIEEEGKHLFAAFVAKKEGGLAEMIQKPARKARFNFIAEVQKAATQAAVMAGSSVQSTPTPTGMYKFGVDGDKFLSDPSYKNQQLDRAQTLMESGDASLMDALGGLEQNRKW